MLLKIDALILEKYPKVEIGYLLAEVTMKKSDPVVEGLKAGLKEHLLNQGVNATNFVLHPGIDLWRRIYEKDFMVKAKTYRSSVEALVKRVITDKGMAHISNIVDLYNCCSVLSMLPMGGYDLDKIAGGITIRYAKEGEIFWGLGAREKIEPQPCQVVYADEKRLLCWLWNHKDAEESCIDEHTRKVLFFIDAFDRVKVEEALKQLAEYLEKMQCKLLTSGILNHSFAEANLKLS